MKKNHTYITLIYLYISVIGFLAYREFLQINILAYVETKNIWESRRFIAYLVFCVVSLAGLAIVLFWMNKNRLQALNERINRTLPWIKHIIATVSILLPGLMKWTLPLPENFFFGFWMELFLIILFAVFAAFLYSQKNEPGSIRIMRIGVFILLAGAAHSILYKFNSVTDYPFTLYWSEGNRFYDYSTLFGGFRYVTSDGQGIKVFTTWGMQFLWALPFIIPKISIAFYRCWYQLVWIIPSLALGLISVWPASKHKVSSWLIVGFTFWSYLFLDQGPIYPPVIIGALLTILAVRLKLLPGAVLIFLASYFMWNSRWTWSFAPGIWAGMISLLSIQQPTLNRRDWHKLVSPIVLGLSGYLGGQLLPSFISMMNVKTTFQFLPDPAASISRHTLLWARLYPNPTYPPGILVGLVWATLPLVLALAALVTSKRWQVNWLQKSAMFIVTSIFLAVGFIISMKIGGGSNLHNLDLYLVTLWLIASVAIASLSKGYKHLLNFSPYIFMLVFLALVSPATYGMMRGERLTLPPNEKITESMAAVQNKVKEYSQKGNILFIDHRQLLTFGLVKNVPLVDEYEKKYLMNYALMDNKDYFKSFYQDLTDQRFVLIVNEPANIIIRGSEYSFGQENDAYVRWVTKPILCTYEAIYTSFDTGLELLVPRKTSPPEELNCEVVLNQ